MHLKENDYLQLGCRSGHVAACVCVPVAKISMVSLQSLPKFLCFTPILPVSVCSSNISSHLSHLFCLSQTLYTTLSLQHMEKGKTDEPYPIISA